MHAAQFDPELSRQMFENAIATVAMSFIALAAFAAMIVCLFIVWECVQLTDPPKRSQNRDCGDSRRMQDAGQLQLVRGSGKGPHSRADFTPVSNAS